MKKTLLIFALTALFSAASQAQPEKYLKLKVYSSAQNNIATLAKTGINLENIESKPGQFIIGEFSESELNIIKEAGFSFDVLIPDMAQYYVSRNKGLSIAELNGNIKENRRTFKNSTTPVNFKLGSFAGYHSYSELLAELDEMRSLFPGLISVKQPIDGGLTIENRPVYWVRISNNPDNEQEKRRVLYTALTHAREPAGMQQMLYQMWYLLENYENDAEIKYLVDNLEIYFIPCVNPDGYVFNQTESPSGGGMWRKNRRNNLNGTKGIDLNRNFGHNWGYDDLGSSPNGSSETYRGTAPFSEPETQLVKHFVETKNFDLALNNHTYSNILIYPWGYANETTPDAELLGTYASLMTETNGYAYGTCYQTLNYTANGGSDDWFYGEQTTKNKVLAFTPEAGNPADGFWPAANKIEEICAGHTNMNQYIARFAVMYAKTVEKTPQLVGSFQFTVPFETTCLGIDTPANFTVSLVPLSNNIEQVSDPVFFNEMSLLEKRSGNINVSLKNGIAEGDEIKFLLSTSNGAFAFTDTVTKVFGFSEPIFTDVCNSLTNWTSTRWGTTGTQYVSPGSCITDSPTGNYLSNANTYITLNQTIDLSEATLASVEFMARWDIEANWDYVQLLASTNGGTTWIPLEGNYTSIGGSHQDEGKPLYHMQQIQWVKETVSLNQLLGQSVKLRFLLKSDTSVEKDGFYFDDFIVHRSYNAPVYKLNLPETIYYKKGGSIQVDFSQLITVEPSSNVAISWEGNENISIESNDWELTFQSNDSEWVGSNVVTFTLNGNLGYISQTVTVECVETTTVPIINGQNELYTYKNTPIDISLDDISVIDDDSSFPSEFSLEAFDFSYFTVNGLTITPELNFVGELSVPIRVSDGENESLPFGLKIDVKTPLDVEESIDNNVRIYFSAAQQTVFIELTESSVYNFVRVIDAFGRVHIAKKIAPNELSIGVSIANRMPVGVYFVQILGNVPVIKRVVLY